jgi:arabinose-5-phosphate isomerase
MHTGSEIPKVKLGSSLSSALLEMSNKGFGLTTIIDDLGNVKGVFTDGDLRRTLDDRRNIDSLLIDDVMSSGYKCIPSNSLAAEAALVMQNENIYVIIVGQNDGAIEGILKMHDLLQANVI